MMYIKRTTSDNTSYVALKYSIGLLTKKSPHFIVKKVYKDYLF